MSDRSKAQMVSAKRGLVAIALIAAGLIAAFAYVGGWFPVGRLGPDDVLNAIEAAGGRHDGFRRAHAKGICIGGWFQATPDARALSTARVFAGERVPVVGRFAIASGDPHAADPSVNVRSMALQLLGGQGHDEWRTGMNSTPGLSVSTPEAFVEQVETMQPDPRTGKPDPAKLQRFLAAHPEAVAFNARMAAQPVSSGFADERYNSVNGFLFVAPDGSRHLVRWSMLPESPLVVLDPADRKTRPANYVFDDLVSRLGKGALRWRLVATIAAPGDPNRAAEVWPADRKQVELGVLTIDHAESEAPGNCRDLNFDPMILPRGMEASDDPILFARSSVYSGSFNRRMEETKPAPAFAGHAVDAPHD